MDAVVNIISSKFIVQITGLQNECCVNSTSFETQQQKMDIDCFSGC